MVPLATPVMREVERTEHPSTRAEMTETFLSVGSLFILLLYYTALACQARRQSRRYFFLDFFTLDQRALAAWDATA